MMEAKHISAVKKPYRRSSHNKPLGQIILINQHLDKLAALRVDLDTRHMLEGQCPCLPPYMQPDAARTGAADTIPAALDESSSDEDKNDNTELYRQHHEPQAADTAGGEPHGDDSAAEPEEGVVGDLEGPTLMAECVLSKTSLRGYPKHVRQLVQAIHVPVLPDKIQRFLYNQLMPNPGPGVPMAAEVPLKSCPLFDANISVFPSAIATYYAPSDPLGPQGMHREWIRSVGSWRGEGPWRNCVFMEQGTDLPGFRSLLVAHVCLFFSFKFHNQFWTLSISIAWCAAPISLEWLGTNTSPTVYDTLIL
ncbi:hypothetical protein BN946_scf184742.g1 [Trametes cinnabarina]|uniref:Uncharacterized protein n=1 Tax=Pycnoporus cinnabarinus TaxID=5643 RepID=A0A060SAJ1_PYCCI|nr:hypothetical protein BN946_scf184742.g1 [Trametes cinnabarina]